MKRLRARFPVVCGCLLALGSIGAFAQSVDDPGFRSEYLRLYQALKGVAQNVIVMEMREHEVRMYTLRDTPIFTCVRGTVGEVVASLG